MGHESEPLDEYLEAHRTCLNDLMYFPTRNAHGLSSVAGNMEKLAALQNEFENVRNELEDGKEKIVWLEKKMRAKKKKPLLQIEAIFKQMDIAETELECFEALQKLEQLTASYRINNLWAEVHKQKELDKTLQNRYGSLLEELEKIQNMMDRYRVQAQQKEEIEVKNLAHEYTKTTADKIDVQGIDNCEVVSDSVEHGSAIRVYPSHDDIVQDQATSNPKNDMDVGSDIKQMIPKTDVKLLDDATIEKVEGTSTDGYIDNGETTLDMDACCRGNK